MLGLSALIFPACPSSRVIASSIVTVVERLLMLEDLIMFRSTQLEGPIMLEGLLCENVYSMQSQAKRSHSTILGGVDRARGPGPIQWPAAMGRADTPMGRGWAFSHRQDFSLRWCTRNA